MSILQTALTLFLVTNPIGNTPAILALVKPYPPARQRAILIREGIASLCLALFFLFLGDLFLSQLAVKSYTVSFTGGILLILVALSMIFAHQDPGEDSIQVKQEPYIVPIATPLLSGPGLLTMIMIFGQDADSYVPNVIAICLSSLAVIGVLASGPMLLRVMSERGLTLLERLMGLVLCLLGVEMVVGGTVKFINAL